MNPRLILALTAAFSTVSFAQIINTGVPDSFQVTYVTNITASQNNKSMDSVINLSNSGAAIDLEESLGEGMVAPSMPARRPLGPRLAFGGAALGNICANIYAFDANEEMLSCCSCVVTPGGLTPIGAGASLFSKTLTGEMPNSGVIKVVSTLVPTSPCDPTSIDPFFLAPGMLGSRTTLHTTPTGSLAVTETSFSQSDLSQSELNHLTSFCGFISANGGGGTCTGCPTGF